MPRNKLLSSADLIGTLRAKNWSTVCNKSTFIIENISLLKQINVWGQMYRNDMETDSNKLFPMLNELPKPSPK